MKKLIEDYKKLQLRVTRFSATEQELINTRDKLDQELELYKRLQTYSSQFLENIDDNSFYQLVAEAVVDVLEVEASFVFCVDKGEEKENLATEGLYNIFDFSEFKQQIVSLAHKHHKRQVIQCQNCDLYGELARFSGVLLYHDYDAELDYSVYILALVSNQYQKHYKSFDDRYLTIYSLLSQQVRTVVSSRKRSEKIAKQIELISESEQELKKLSLIATKSKNGVVITDRYGKIDWVNTAFTNITGFDLSEVRGKKPKDFLHREKTEKEVIDKISKRLKAEKDVAVTITNYRKNGSSYYNQLEIIPVFNARQKLVNFIAIQRDITEETKFKQQLIEVNSRFQLISEAGKIGIWEWSTASDSIQWNEVLYKIYEIPSQVNHKDLFRQWQNSIHIEDRDYVKSQIAKLRNGEVDKVEKQYRIITKTTKKAKVIKALTVAERDNDGNLIRLVGSEQDITELDNLQQGLKKAILQRDQSINTIEKLKSFYERILTNSPVNKLVFDSELNLSFSNSKNIIPHWNLPIGANLFTHFNNSLTQSVHTVLNNISLAIDNHEQRQIEERVVLKNGIEKVFLHNIFPYYTTTNKLENVIVQAIDITELKNVQAQIETQNAELKKINHELDNFVYSISHDLRSPLLSIKGIFQLLMSKEEMSADGKKFMEMAQKSVERLDGTIKEILDYSRNARQDLQLSEFDLRKLIYEIVEDLKFSKNKPIDVSVRFNGNTSVFSDKSRMNVLLKNIIGNSFKYVRNQIKSFIKIDITRTNSKLTMIISDNGEGIKKEYLERVFDMFFRGTNNSIGTGLGLYICSEIVNKMKGEIGIESTYGQGTVITIELPIK